MSGVFQNEKDRCYTAMTSAVFLFHGFYPMITLKDHSLKPLANRLAKQITYLDADVIQVTFDRCHQRSITEMAESVQDSLRHAQMAYEAVFVVGHSMGGLIGAELARSRPDLVTGLVTIASPLSGPTVDPPKSKLITRLSPPIAQMRSDSEFLKTLKDSQSLKGVKSLGLAARYDVLVPRSSALPEGFHSQTITINNSTHLSIVLKEQTAHEVALWMEFEVNKKPPGPLFGVLGAPFVNSTEELVV